MYEPSPSQSRAIKMQVRDLIRDHPERHKQTSWVSNVFKDEFGESLVDRIRSWFWHSPAIPSVPMDDDKLCGTTACVAGWGAILGSPLGTRIKTAEYSSTRLVYPDGTEEEVQDAAMRLMDLDEYQADWLFDAVRTRTEVLRALDTLIDYPRTELDAGDYDDEDDDEEYDDYDESDYDDYDEDDSEVD